MSKKPYKIRVLNVDTGNLIHQQLLTGVPNVGDEIRLGEIGNEVIYTVQLVVWCFNEQSDYERVNLGVRNLLNSQNEGLDQRDAKISELHERLESVRREANDMVMVGGFTVWESIASRNPEMYQWFTNEGKAK